MPVTPTTAQPAPALAHRPEPPAFNELVSVFARIGLLSFGGPAGQIALMHRSLVFERRWLSEERFLHALNYCMLLPGPEAMQLATYVGWLLHGVRGGLTAGLLFLAPGAVMITALSALYLTAGEAPLVAGLFFGIKAAVLAIVAEALLRVARRALACPVSVVTAVAAFVAIAGLGIPFPLIVLLAALAGALAGPASVTVAGAPDATALPDWTSPRLGKTLATLMIWLGVWFVPLIALQLIWAPDHVLAQQARFFSVMATVTFGGAYAVLSYVAQQAVEAYGWLQPDEMLTGLGLAETTPGPLILVLVFVGFLGAARQAGLDPLLGGTAGALVALWFTFVPCFLWIFVGAPYVEMLRQVRWLARALAGVTAAVVGIIANLALWFGLHVLFAEVEPATLGAFRLEVPVLGSFDAAAAAIAALAGVALFVLRLPMLAVLGLAAATGIVIFAF